jgi:AmmeMemoRadiSam system protein A
MLTKKEQEFLLELAKKAIEAHPNHYDVDSEEISGVLKEKKGVFVTVHLNGQLRGCIGHTMPVMPLYKAVIENAVNAAYKDPRFPPLEKRDASRLEIEISVLSEPVKLWFTSPEELLKKLNKEEGIIIKKGIHTATFLPQVWEQIEDKQEFMAHLCFKAGLSPGAWKENNTEIYSYKAERFSN